VEIKLADIWAEVLALDEIGINDNFLELGGDSVRAMQVVTQVKQQFGVDLTFGAFLRANPTIAEVAAIVGRIRETLT
jgi:acyl carrier protein